jgi:mono/diheme cytochrome c family protein
MIGKSTGATIGGLVLLIAASAWSAPRAADSGGERLYDAHCRKCHGAEGRGTTRAPSLVPFDWTEKEALDLVRRPVCDMPPIPASVLSNAQVAQIVSYLKTIKASR